MFHSLSSDLSIFVLRNILAKNEKKNWIQIGKSRFLGLGLILSYESRYVGIVLFM